ncbi:MAG TPA: response regulator transcription factor [Acidimicrobiales bacterium]|nr:response regulator transcription factor [Acidimicrobiales bacterium]
MIRVVVQQRHRLFRHGLAMLLHDEPDIEVVGTAPTGAELLRVCERSQPDVVVLEADAPDWDADRLCITLLKRHGRIRVVGLHDDRDPTAGRRAHRAGMAALLSTSAGVTPLLAALRERSTGQTVTPIAARFPPPPPPPSRGPLRSVALTEREREVLAHVGCGETSREICLQLGISRKTVENHKQRIFAKLDVQNQAHAIALAMRRGLIAHPSPGRPITG